MRIGGSPHVDSQVRASSVEVKVNSGAADGDWAEVCRVVLVIGGSRY
jgi:hypothetical protein